MVRETLPDGEKRIGLPTGYLLVHRPGEEPWVLGPDGGRLPASHQDDESGLGLYGFIDSLGNQVVMQPSEMAFAVRNPEGTVTQQVHSSGAQLIEAQVTYEQRGSGRTREVTQRVIVDPDGQIQQESELPGGMRVAPDGMEFGTRKVRLDLPYRIPQELQGPAAAPPRAQDAPQPAASPAAQADRPQAAPDVIFQPSPSDEGMTSEAPQPPPPQPGPTDTTNGIAEPPPGLQTPSGMIRQLTAEGTLVISLPNGVAMYQSPDGSAVAFDARSEGAAPVAIRPRPRPDGSAELQYDFCDAAGNRYTMFSESQDFAVTAADGRTRQVVLPQGNILVGIQGQDGRSHRMEVLPNGAVNTFGEGGIQMGGDRVLFGSAQPPEMVAMPYPIPIFQEMISAMHPLAPQVPVSGLIPPEFQGIGMPGGFPPGYGAGMPGGFPPGYGAGMPGGFPPGYGAGMPGGFPPGYEAGMPGGFPPGYGAGMPGGFPPGYGSPGQVAPSVTPQPGHPQQPIKPGLWQRIKNFFSDHDQRATPPGRPAPYPCQRHTWTHDPMMGLVAASTAVTAMNTALLAGSMMMFPMGMFCSPFMPFGGGCWWR